MANERATKAEAVAQAVQTRTEPKPETTFRQVRGVPLLYGEIIKATVSVPLKFLGIHAQQEARWQQQGKRVVPKSRYVHPELIYEFNSSKRQEELQFYLMRGKGELPMNDGNRYDFIAMTVDRNPDHNCVATVWLVTPLGKEDDED